MKKTLFQYLLLITVAFCVISFNPSNFSFHKQEFSSGPPAAKTGAPGEGNCTNCHSGSVQSGTGIVNTTFSGSNNEYIHDTTYTITLDLTGAGNKNGFEIVAYQDSNNTPVGSWTITDATNTKLIGTDYVAQTGAGSNQSSWTFDWTAPSTNAGDITFYLSALLANGNNGSDGDQVYLSEFTITPSGSIGITEFEALNQSFEVYISAGSLNMTFEYVREAEVNISVFDINGKHVFSNGLGHHTGGKANYTSPIQTAANGVYIVNLFLDNRVLSRKIQL